MKDGFTNTLLNIFRNSVVIGMFVITMTLLTGMLKHTSGAQHLFVILLIAAVLFSSFIYVKKEASRRW